MTGIARGSALLLAGNVAASAGFFVTALLLSRILGPAGRGAMAFIVVTTLVSMRFVSVGVFEAMTIFAARRPRLQPALLSTLLAFSCVSALVGATLVSLALGILDLFEIELIGDREVIALGIAIAFGAPQAALLQFLRGTGSFPQFASLTVLSPWTYAVALLAAWGSVGLDVESAAFAWAGSSVLVAVLTVAYVGRLIGFARPRRRLLGAGLAFGLRAWIGSLSNFLNARADQIVIGFIATEASLGIYSAAVNWSEVLLYLPSAVASALLPSIAQIAAAGERRDQVLQVFRQVTAFTIVTILLAAPIGAVLIPLVFGAAFQGSVVPFLLLLPGAIGYGAIVVFRTGHEVELAPGVASLAYAVALVVGLALDFALVPRFGASGAAVAASVAFTVGGAASIAGYWRRHGFPPALLVPSPHELVALFRLSAGLVRRAGRPRRQVTVVEPEPLVALPDDTRAHELALAFLRRRADGLELVTSAQSDCYFFDDESGGRYVLKMMRNDYVHNSRETAAREFTALSLFWKAAQGRDDIGVPEPIGVVSLGSDYGYIMRRVEGIGLVALGKTVLSGDTRQIAERLLVGLRLFHEAAGAAYEDFHPHNVLVDETTRLWFIDPTIPDPLHAAVRAEMRFPPLSTDIGHWVFEVARDSSLLLLKTPRRPHHLTKLTVELVAQAAEAHGAAANAFVDDVFRTAGRHLSSLAAENPRRRVLAAISTVPLVRMQAKTRRRLRPQRVSI